VGTIQFTLDVTRTVSSSALQDEKKVIRNKMEIYFIGYKKAHPAVGCKDRMCRN